MVSGVRSLAALTATCMLSCAHADAGPESPVARALLAVDPATLRVTSGVLTNASATSFRVEHPSFRAEVGEAPRHSVEMTFVYRGPGRQQAALASGELRRQIGLKLRARDACNVIYVMWHIEPSQGLEVSVKSNPGQSTHEECLDRGYRFIKPSFSRADLPVVEAGAPRTLSVTLSGDTLRVDADGQPAWMGVLPPQEFDGPVGVRTDNGVFDIELRTSAASSGERPDR